YRFGMLLHLSLRCSESTCFGVRYSNDLMISFQQARNYCSSTGGNLASIRSDLEAQLVIRLIEDAGIQAKRRVAFWIGLRKARGQCTVTHTALRGYRWTSGEGDTPYANWVSSPDRTCTRVTCVSLVYAHSGKPPKWKGRNCQTSRLVRVHYASADWTYSDLPCLQKRCEHGYEPHGDVCQDIDECTEEPCEHIGFCSNTAGSFICECLDGYTVVNTTGCADVDECQFDPCDFKCLNTDGSFEYFSVCCNLGMMVTSDVGLLVFFVGLVLLCIVIVNYPLNKESTLDVVT
uniref:C-type lectin domain-containing protein n=1 Tax=Eptatretus burgeri TaxID=7764 RepID=A0A8C4NFA7_EPTBU